MDVSGGSMAEEGYGSTHDLALVFLLLRFSRRTRFFLHFALILTMVDVSIMQVKAWVHA